MLDHNGDCYVVGGMFVLEARFFKKEEHCQSCLTKNEHLKSFVGKDLIQFDHYLCWNHVYLYNKLGWPSFSIRPFCRPSRRPFVLPSSIQGKEREEEEEDS
jgi:hypothetical protein